MWEDNVGFFQWRKHHGLWNCNLATSDSLKLKSLIDWFVFLQTRRFLLHKILIWWTWVTCALLWCFYQLFELIFWRHPFTLVSKSVSMKKRTYLHLGCAWCRCALLTLFLFGSKLPCLDQVSVKLHDGKESLSLAVKKSCPSALLEMCVMNHETSFFSLINYKTDLNCHLTDILSQALYFFQFFSLHLCGLLWLRMSFKASYCSSR